jgi:hypothetical protein
MLLTVELTDTDNINEVEVAICFDDEGLENLIKSLMKLRGIKKDHDHLMTPAWGGHELSDTKKGGKESILVNHLRLVKF